MLSNVREELQRKYGESLHDVQMTPSRYGIGSPPQASDDASVCPPQHDEYATCAKPALKRSTLPAVALTASVAAGDSPSTPR
jgi:hypothetical protein